jgi:competence ComEA-like helix-hairpin-helix protein
MELESPDPGGRVTGWLLTAASIVLASALSTTAAAPQNQESKPDKTASQPPARNGDAEARAEEEFARVGEETIEKVCIMCHPWENIVRARRTVRQWEDVVTTMAGRGANGTEDQFATVKQYLTRYYGLVPVNTASAADLSAVLGLSSKDAEAIVAYRTAHGRFADIAALSKVEGVDKSKIEEQPEALLFK